MCPQKLGCTVTESCYLQRMTSEEGEMSFDSTLTASKGPARLQYPFSAKGSEVAWTLMQGVPESCACAVILLKRHQPRGFASNLLYRICLWLTDSIPTIIG